MRFGPCHRSNQQMVFTRTDPDCWMEGLLMTAITNCSRLCLGKPTLPVAAGPPRTNRAPLPAPGRSEDLPQRRERGQMHSQYHSPFVADYVLPLVGIVEAKSLLTPPPNPKIRAPPVGDVNNLRHDC